MKKLTPAQAAFHATLITEGSLSWHGHQMGWHGAVNGYANALNSGWSSPTASTGRALVRAGLATETVDQIGWSTFTLV